MDRLPDRAAIQLSKAYPMLLELAVLCVFPWAMAFGGAMDFFTMTIPNRVSIFMVVGFCVLAPFLGIGLNGFMWHLISGLLMLALGAFLFYRGIIGGGDAKLFAAGALWVGFDHLMLFTLYAALAGGVLTLAIVAYRYFTLPDWMSRQAWAARLHDPAGGVPYGIALAAGAMMTYPLMKWLPHTIV